MGIYEYISIHLKSWKQNALVFSPRKISVKLYNFYPNELYYLFIIFFTERISLKKKNKNKYLAIHEYMQNFASIGVQWKCDHEPTCIGRKLASPIYKD